MKDFLVQPVVFVSAEGCEKDLKRAMVLLLDISSKQTS
jgi:hypothetical protein